MFEPDEFQRKALATWYKPDNPLRNDPTHPAIKLAGEAGELLDLWGKDGYKPNFNWWRCKTCGETHTKDEWVVRFDESKNPPYELICKTYTPLVLDELGDFSYYLRILAYQQQVTFEHLVNLANIPDSVEMSTLLAELNLRAAFVLSIFLSGHTIFYSDLLELTGLLLAVLSKLDCPLEKLMELNYQKLNSDPTNHGWREAR